MKILILAVTLFLTYTLQVQADDSINFDYTGDYASNYGSVDHPEYYASPSPIPIGGPSNDGGAAEQFQINTLTNISALDVNAVVFGSGNPPHRSTLPTTFVYQLYSGSSYTVEGATNSNEPVPKLSTLMMTSSPLTFTDPSAISANTTTSTYKDMMVPLKIELQPGTYWLAELGNGQAVVETQQSYIDPPVVGNTVQTPEPMVGGLFAGLLVFILLKGRKYRPMA